MAWQMHNTACHADKQKAPPMRGFYVFLAALGWDQAMALI